MRTREEWKTTIDEIGELKDKFIKIKQDSEDLLKEVKRIALSSFDEAKEIIHVAKENMSSVVETIMGQEKIGLPEDQAKASHH